MQSKPNHRTKSWKKAGQQIEGKNQDNKLRVKIKPTN